MATPTKSLASAVLAAWQTVTNTSIAVGTEASVTTKFSSKVHIRLGRAAASAFTAGWPNVRIETAGRSTGNADWTVAYSYQMAVGSSAVSSTLNGAIVAGATTATITTIGAIAKNDYLYLGHTTLTSNYELVRVKSVSGSVVTLEEPCTYAHDNGCVVSNQSESVQVSLDLTADTRIRAVIDNAGSGQSVFCEVTMSTCDSIG